MTIGKVARKTLPMIALAAVVLGFGTEKAAVAQMIAFQDATHQLQVFNRGTITPLPYFVKAGTVPSLVPYNGGYAIGYQGTNGNFWLYSNGNSLDSGGAMAGGTSPSITVLNGQIAFGFQGSNGRLWISQGGLMNGQNTNAAMAGGTSPSLAGLPNGQLAMAFQGSNGHLWVSMTGPTHGYDTGGVMQSGTSPSIAAFSNSEIYYTFHGVNGNLWSGRGNGLGGSDSFRYMYPGSSPSAGVDVSGYRYVALWTGPNAAIGVLSNSGGDVVSFTVYPYTRSPTLAISGTTYSYAFKSNGKLTIGGAFGGSYNVTMD